MSTDPSDFVQPIDGSQHGNNPVSASMESIIAAALAEHYDVELEHGYWSCVCGADLGVLLPDELHQDHQARAVLGAISEAGAVEWGWEYRGLIGGKYDRRVTRNWIADRALTREEAQSEVDNMNSRHPDIARLIHRTATAWTAAEG